MDLCNQKITFNLAKTLLIATLKMQSVDLLVDFLLITRLVLARNNQTQHCFFILSCSRHFQPSLLESKVLLTSLLIKCLINLQLRLHTLLKLHLKLRYFII